MQIPDLSFLREKLRSKTVILGGIIVLFILLGGLGGYFFFKHKLEQENEGMHQQSHKKTEETKEEGVKKEETKTPERNKNQEDKTGVSEEEKLDSAESLHPHTEIVTAKQVCADPARHVLTLIVTDLGLSEEHTERAIRELPQEVVLSFSPYAKMLNQWSLPTKTSGHQMVIQLHSEKSLEDMDILTYFDAVLLMPVEEPEKNKIKLESFLITLQDQQKMILDARLFMESPLELQASKRNVPIIKIDGQITGENIAMDKVDCLAQKGIFMIDATLVPYLIEQIEKHPDVKFAPLSPLKKKDS